MIKPQPQPLLAARHGRRQWRLRIPPAAWLLLSALGITLGLALLGYLWAPEPEAAKEAAADEDLHALHHNPSHAFCGLGSHPMVCAHGGDASSAPPNTARAFRAALEGGVRCVEVDVARTRDGQLVVLHSRELAHLLHLPEGQAALAAWTAVARQGPEGALGQQQPQVRDFTWGQLRQLRWEGGEGVELVAAVLALVLPDVDHVTLDVKTYSQHGVDTDEDLMAQQVVDLLEATPLCRGKCLVWAKSDRVVAAVKALAPRTPVGFVVMNETEQARALGLNDPLRLPQAEVVALHHAMASASLAQHIRAAGKAVHAWTANTAAMMARVLDAGVDAVVTNHPRRLAEALSARAAACRRRAAA